MRIPLLRGREFTPADSDAAPRVVVVNDSFAKLYFAGADPIGRTIKPGLSTTERETPWRAIVGVVGDIKQEALNESARAAYFVPYAQGLITTPHILMRADGDADALVESARKIVAAMDPALAATQTFYEGAGCIECGGTGFKGRTAICELLDLSDRIREMILDRRPNSEVKKAAHEEGMRFLRESAIEKVLLGLTTLREINKVTFVE